MHPAVWNTVIMCVRACVCVCVWVCVCLCVCVSAELRVGHFFYDPTQSKQSSDPTWLARLKKFLIRHVIYDNM